MDRDELQKRADALRWYHTIDLGQGVVTRGVDNTPERLARVHLPDDLSGKTVLDIGAWDGFFSFEAERRRASRVVACDYYAWHGVGWGTGRGKDGFELARTALNSRVEDVALDVMDLSPEQDRDLRRRLLPRRAVSPAEPAARARARGVGVEGTAHPRDRGRHGGHRQAGRGVLPGQGAERRPDELVGPESRGRAGDADQRRVLARRRDHARAFGAISRGARRLPSNAGARTPSRRRSGRTARCFTPTRRRQGGADEAAAHAPTVVGPNLQFGLELVSAVRVRQILPRIQFGSPRGSPTRIPSASPGRRR